MLRVPFLQERLFPTRPLDLVDPVVPFLPERSSQSFQSRETLITSPSLLGAHLRSRRSILTGNSWYSSRTVRTCFPLKTHSSPQAFRLPACTGV